MQSIENNHPNRIFKFVHLRGVRKFEAQGDPVFVQYPDSPPPQASLHAKLAAAQAGSYTAGKQEVVSYKQTQAYLTSYEGLEGVLTGILKFHDWVYSHIDVLTRSSITTAISTHLGLSASQLVASTPYKSAVTDSWDNLYVQCFLYEHKGAGEGFCRMLGLLHLIQIIASTQDDFSAEQLRKMATARPLLKRFIHDFLQDFPVSDETSVNTNQAGTRQAERQALLLKFNKYQDVENELKKLAGKKATAARLANKPNTVEITQPEAEYSPDSDFFVLTTVELEALSPESQLVMEELGLEGQKIDILYVTQLLQTEARKAAAAVAGYSNQRAVMIAGNLVGETDLCFEFEETNPCGVDQPANFNAGGSFVNAMFVGDLIVTDQYLIKYDLGEVAHIETVMKSQKRERTHRRLDRKEVSTFSEYESSSETERETQTAERFSIEKQTSKVLAQQMQISTGVNISAWGPHVSVDAGFQYGYGTSSSTSSSEATAFSKEVTDRALTRVKEAFRESTLINIINETEETSLLSYDNTDPAADHINGVYRWVDKYYMNKLINYGRRLMLEFTIPEPANFFLFQKMHKPQEGTVVEVPLHPKDVEGPEGNKLTDFTVISESNYAFWVSKYGVQGVEPPPQGNQIVSSTIELTFDITGNDASKTVPDLLVPKGYVARQVYVRQNFANSVGSSTYTINISVGDFSVQFYNPGTAGPSPLSWLPHNGDIIPVTVKIWGPPYLVAVKATVIVMVLCTRTDNCLSEWQMKVYEQILTAYQEQQRRYEEWLNQKTIFNIGDIGNNPGINRQTEREELKKRCIEMFSGQRFESFDAAVNGISSLSGYPEILFNESIKEGNILRHYEQAFDWDKMTYVFYPYFYGRKKNWVTIKSFDGAADPLFGKFLQAGYAKIVVPVNPGYETQVVMNHLLVNWFTGGTPATVPGVEDDPYVSLMKEIETGETLTVETGTIIGYHVQKVPTDLVYLVPNTMPTPPSWPGLPDHTGDGNIVDPFTH